MTAFDPSMLPPRPAGGLTDEEREQAKAALAGGGGWQGRVIFLHWFGAQLADYLGQKGYQLRVEKRLTGWTMTVDVPQPSMREDVKAIGQ